MATNPNQPPAPIINPQQSFIYVVPITYSPEDDETYINKKSVMSLECTPVPENDLNSLWNCTRCGNDDNYCTPVEDADIIYHQFMINDPEVLLYAIFVYDGNGNIVESAAATNVYTVQDKENGNNYLNINVDVSLLSTKCFYLAVYGFKCVIDGAAVATCTEDRMAAFGESYSQASFTCLTEACEEYNTYFTDMYCKQDCQDTLLIEGEYPLYDCEGNFYGIPYLGNTSQQHKLKFRVPAEIEITDYSFEETIVNNKKTKAKQIENWLFRTQKIPPYVVAQIAKAFNSRTFTIDGVAYTNANNLTKNFEEGRMWIIQETLQKECDEINFTCE